MTHMLLIFVKKESFSQEYMVMQLQIFFIIFDMEAQKCHQFGVQYF